MIDSNDDDKPKRLREESSATVALQIHLPTISKKV